ncbi:MAG: MipA/OmpV family protein [Rhodoferax sp.]|nr:MipA/OmpV family protein [Rhodoferax sp.]
MGLGLVSGLGLNTAQGQTSEPAPGTGLPLWEIGLAGAALSQPAYPGAADRAQRLLGAPYLVYRGETLRVDRGSAGLRAIRTPNFELDVGFSGSLGSRAEDVAARRGMADLGTLVEFGPRLKWNLGPADGPTRWRLELPARGVFDLSNGLAQRGIAIEPEWLLEHRTAGGLRTSAGLGVVWGNQRLADTFYRVDAGEATADRSAYAARPGLMAWRLSASVSQQLAPGLRLFGYGRLDSLTGAANRDSPLVQRASGLTVGLALAYTWKQSTERASD